MPRNERRDVPWINATSKGIANPDTRPCNNYEESRTGLGVCKCGFSLGGHKQ